MDIDIKDAGNFVEEVGHATYTQFSETMRNLLPDSAAALRAWDTLDDKEKLAWSDAAGSGARKIKQLKHQAIEEQFVKTVGRIQEDDLTLLYAWEAKCDAGDVVHGFSITSSDEAKACAIRAREEYRAARKALYSHGRDIAVFDWEKLSEPSMETTWFVTAECADGARLIGSSTKSPEDAREQAARWRIKHEAEKAAFDAERIRPTVSCNLSGPSLPGWATLVKCKDGVMFNGTSTVSPEESRKEAIKLREEYEAELDAKKAS